MLKWSPLSIQSQSIVNRSLHLWGLFFWLNFGWYYLGLCFSFSAIGHYLYWHWVVCFYLYGYYWCLSKGLGDLRLCTCSYLWRSIWKGMPILVAYGFICIWLRSFVFVTSAIFSWLGTLRFNESRASLLGPNKPLVPQYALIAPKTMLHSISGTSDDVSVSRLLHNINIQSLPNIL